MHIQPHSLRLAAAPLVAIIADNATIATLHTIPLPAIPLALAGRAPVIVFVVAGATTAPQECSHPDAVSLDGTAALAV